MKIDDILISDYKDWLQTRVNGHLVSSEYFRLAMTTFRERHRSNASEVLFVMASDDIDWCQAMFSNETDVVFASTEALKYKVKQPTFDLAVLSLCHHSIIRQVLYHFRIECSVTRLKLPNVFKKMPKNDFNRKMTDFDTFAKIANECGRFVHINCCLRL